MESASYCRGYLLSVVFIDLFDNEQILREFTLKIRRATCDCTRVLSTEEKNLLSLSFTTILIDHFTVVCLVSWPLNESEAGVDLVLIETYATVKMSIECCS